MSALVAVSSPPAAAQSGSTASVTSYQLDVDAAKQWLDTKIDLRAGEKLRFTATGTIAYPADKKHPDGRSFGPDGLARGFGDLIHEYAVSNADHGSLIGRLGDDNIAQPFAIGASTDYEAPVAGRLFLGINQSLRDAEFAKGNFQVKIAVLNPGLSTAAAMATSTTMATRSRSKVVAGRPSTEVDELAVTFVYVWAVAETPSESRTVTITR